MTRRRLWIGGGVGLGGVAAALLAFLLLGPTLRGLPEPDPARMAALESEIDTLRASFEVRLAADSLLRWIREEEGETLIGIRTDFAREIADWAARAYLDDVRLHLAPDVAVEEGAEVRTSIGPLKVSAGRWRVRVTIRSVQATLRADTIALAVASPSLMSADIAIGVSDAAGDADVYFSWDAATLASVVCRDFEIEEPFGGVVAPFTYRLAGAFRFEATPEGIMAMPEFDRPRLRLRPQPTSESWSRVNALLDRQNNIFRCGLALKPDDMVEKLRRLLGTGFEFQLPEILFRPVRLPARFADRLSIDGQEVEVRSVPVHLHLTPIAIWYGLDLEVGAPTESAEVSAGP